MFGIYRLALKGLNTRYEFEYLCVSTPAVTKEILTK
jgi:hypothetical protein